VIILLSSTKSLDSFRSLLIAVSGWMNQPQLQQSTTFEKRTECRVNNWAKRLRFNDDQHRRLAATAKGLGSKLLRDVAMIVTPETLPAWHRRLIAHNMRQRQPGMRPTEKSEEIEVVRMAKKTAVGLSANPGSTLQSGS
jgi:hypothetical protein